MGIGNKIEAKLLIILLAIILVIVVVETLAIGIPLMAQSIIGLGSNMTPNASGITVPFGQFFTSGGIILLILGAVTVILVLVILFTLLKGSSGKR